LTAVRAVGCIKIFVDCCQIVTSVALGCSVIDMTSKPLFIAIWIYVALVVATGALALALTVFVSLETLDLRWTLMAIASVMDVVIFVFFAPVLGNYYKMLRQKEVQEADSKRIPPA
jgi:hypothetical protein